MGCEAETVSTVAELDAVFARARAADHTDVIAMQTSPSDWTEDGVFWEVGVPEVSNRSSVLAAYAEMQRGRQAQRLV